MLYSATCLWYLLIIEYNIQVCTANWKKFLEGCFMLSFYSDWDCRASFILAKGGIVQEERWLDGSAPDCKSVVLGSNPAPPQHTVNSISPGVGSHLG
jgi:hypothetical protein